MSSEPPFSNLHADLTRLLPPDSSGLLDLECFYSYRYDCLESFANQINRSLFISNDTDNPFPLKHFENMCQDDKPQAWVTERAYGVALTMAILGCIGLAGNIMSCVVIATHLLKFSGTFALFLFLSISDSLVVVMQVIDAYRNFVAVSQYTAIVSENELTLEKIHRRDWSCKTFLFFWHFALQLSAWLVMALSVDRYVSLKHIQFIRSRPFLYRRAWIIVGSIVAVLFLLNLPFLLFVKSAVIKTHCALNHFCIFGGWDSLKSKSSNSQTKPLSKRGVTGLSDGTEAKAVLEVLSIGEAVESPTARWISLWLSRQHLLIFGIVPYVVTFIFNMILIHYLCSCPPKANANLADLAKGCRSHTCVEKNKKSSPRLSNWNCLASVFCFSQRGLTAKRKSTTTIPLVVLNKVRNGGKGDTVSRNNQIEPNFPPARNNDVQSGMVLPVHNEQGGNGIHLSTGRRPPATSTLINETTDCSGHHCMAKCTVYHDDQNGADKSHDSVRALPAPDEFDVGRQYRAHSANQPRLNGRFASHRRAQTSGSGFWIGQKRTTILLLVVTFTFIGLTLPYHIYVELEHFHKVNKGASTHYDLVHMADDLCRFLLFLNNCMNFIIYMTGRQFRKGFFLIWYRMRQSLIRWLMCQSPQTNSTWHRHPPNKRRRNRHRRVVCDQKQACRLILAANQVGHGVYVHQHYVVHKPGCPLAVNRVSAASSDER